MQKIPKIKFFVFCLFYIYEYVRIIKIPLLICSMKRFLLGLAGAALASDGTLPAVLPAAIYPMSKQLSPSTCPQGSHTPAIMAGTRD